MHTRATNWLLLLLLAFTLSSPSDTCQADCILALTTDGSASDFQVAAGGTIDIPIYLVQTNGDTRFNSVGLYSAGVTVRFNYDSGTAGNAQFVSASIAPSWDSPIINYVDTSDINNLVAIDVGRAGPPVVPLTTNLDHILIGTIRMSAGSLGNVTGLNLSTDSFYNFAKNLFVGQPDGIEFSPTFAGGRILTVTATPEPSTLVLTLIPAAAFGWRRLRLKRRTTR